MASPQSHPHARPRGRPPQDPRRRARWWSTPDSMCEPAVMSQWITVREAAEIIGVHMSAVLKMVRRGDLTPREQRPRLHRAQVEALRDARAVPKPKPASGPLAHPMTRTCYKRPLLPRCSAAPWSPCGRAQSVDACPPRCRMAGAGFGWTTSNWWCAQRRLVAYSVCRTDRAGLASHGDRRRNPYARSARGARDPRYIHCTSPLLA